MKEKNLKDKFTREILKNFDSLNYKNLSIDFSILMVNEVVR